MKLGAMPLLHGTGDLGLLNTDKRFFQAWVRASEQVDSIAAIDFVELQELAFSRRRVRIIARA